MGKTKIDRVKAIEMRVNGATLREIGIYFNTSAEAVRQALQRAEKHKRQQKKLARLLVSASIGEQGSAKSPADIAKTIDDWTAVLEAAKRGITIESEIASLKKRLSRMEILFKLEKNLTAPPSGEYNRGRKRERLTTE